MTLLSFLLLHFIFHFPGERALLVNVLFSRNLRFNTKLYFGEIIFLPIFVL